MRWLCREVYTGRSTRLRWRFRRKPRHRLAGSPGNPPHRAALVSRASASTERPIQRPRYGS